MEGQITLSENELDEIVEEIGTPVEKAEEAQNLPVETVKAITTPYFNPILWNQMKGMAAVFIKSRALPTHLDSVEKVIIQMQTGIEMGMKPMESIQSLYIVNGSVNIWGKATIKALRRHGWSIEYVSEDEDHCTARVSKIGTGESYEDTFRYQDAVDSGYTMDSQRRDKIGWRKGANRTQKMRYNVLSKIIKSYVPEVLEGIAEIQEVYEDVGEDNHERRPENKGGKVKNVKVTTPQEQDKKIKDFLNKAK